MDGGRWRDNIIDSILFSLRRFQIVCPNCSRNEWTKHFLLVAGVPLCYCIFCLIRLIRPTEAHDSWHLFCCHLSRLSLSEIELFNSFVELRAIFVLSFQFYSLFQPQPWVHRNIHREVSKLVPDPKRNSKNCRRPSQPAYRKSIKMVRTHFNLRCWKVVFNFIILSVTTMQRMVGQIGTAQDSPDHKQQL